MNRVIVMILFLLVAIFPVKSMADLSESTCATLIVDQLKAQNPDIASSGQEANLISFWTAICKGLIDHIKAAAVVDVTTSGATGTGPFGGPLPLVAVPGTGTVK